MFPCPVRNLRTSLPLSDADSKVLFMRFNHILNLASRNESRDARGRKNSQNCQVHFFGNDARIFAASAVHRKSSIVHFDDAETGRCVAERICCEKNSGARDCEGFARHGQHDKRKANSQAQRDVQRAPV